MIFNLTSSAIPTNAKVAGFKGTEKISSPYQFDIYFSVETNPLLPLDLDLSDAVFSKATLTVQLGNELPFSYSGILASVRLVRAADSAALFHARLVPQLWQLTLTRHSRIWTNKSVVDIITEVLEESGIDHEFRLESSYPTEEHVAQYKESNLAFISRWMEREGMYYFFEQTDDGDVLVITDNKSSHTSLRLNPVTYFPQNQNDGLTAQAFDNLTATHNALPASVKLIDYDYSRPLLEVSSTVPVESNAVGELAEYGGRVFGPEDAARIANVRAQEQLATQKQFFATGAATQLSAGFKFIVEQHPMLQYNVEYLATRVDHYGYDTSLGAAWGSLVEKKYEDRYRVELNAILSDTQYRQPQTTPWARIDGYENAIVDGPSTSIYAQIDIDGRYKVKFKFDEGINKDGKASTLVRMMQPHGGTQEGFHFPLRKGVEVICSFLGGDPDRPVIVGVVHNQLNQSTVTQNNYTQNVIRTGSLNHIVMEDTAGSMWIDMYCPIFTSTLFLGFGEWNFHLTTMGQGRIHTELNLQIDVNNMWDVDVVNDVTWAFHNHLEWTVDNNVNIEFKAELDWKVLARVGVEFMSTFDFHVVAATTVKMDATLDVTVTGAATFLFSADVDVHIAANLKVKIDANEEQEVGGTRKRKVGGTETIEIGGDQNITITGHQHVDIQGPWQWIKKADEKSLTFGSTTEIFIGKKDSFNLGTFSETTIGLKDSLQVGVFNETTFASKTALSMGTMTDISAADKLSISAGLQLALSAFNINLTGIAVNLTGIDCTLTGVDLVQAGPEVHVEVIAIFI